MPRACCPCGPLCPVPRDLCVGAGAAGQGPTYAAGLRDLVECPQQLTTQVLDVVEVIQHRVGEVHEVVQVDRVSLGPPEGHVECTCLACSGTAVGRRHLMGLWPLFPAAKFQLSRPSWWLGWESHTGL